MAKIRCIPAARAFCAILAISCSTFLPTIIIMSANSSITTTMYGKEPSIGASGGSSSEFQPIADGSNVQSGSIRGLPAFSASSILRLYPAIFLTPKAAINLYRRSISPTHQRSPLAASFISVMTGVKRCGISS